MLSHENRHMSAARSLLELIGVAALLVACASAVTPTAEGPIDRSFTTSQPCAAPCWYGLELNKSTDSEVLAQLRLLPFVNQATIRRSDHVAIGSFQDASEIDYDCVVPSDGMCGFLVLSDGKLRMISFVLKYDLTLRSVVNQLGTPDWIRYDPYTPHGQGCMLDLNWPEKGITVRHIDEDSTALCDRLSSGHALDPAIQATEVHYLTDSAIFSRPSQCGTCIDWPGFQSQ
jgi:hypothetical protein